MTRLDANNAKFIRPHFFSRFTKLETKFTLKCTINSGVWLVGLNLDRAVPLLTPCTLKSVKYIEYTLIAELSGVCYILIITPILRVFHHRPASSLHETSVYTRLLFTLVKVRLCVCKYAIGARCLELVLSNGTHRRQPKPVLYGL